MSMKTVGLVTFALAGGLAFWWMKKQDAPEGTRPIVPLVKETVMFPVRLTPEQQTAAKAACVDAYTRFSHETDLVYFGKPEDFARDVKVHGVTSCDCMVTELQAKSTTLQFALAMAMQFRFSTRGDYSVFTFGDPKKMDGLASAAVAAGVAERQFKAVTTTIEPILATASKICSQKYKKMKKRV